MPRSLAVRCPECDAGLKLPETRSGKSISCPKCQHTFAAPKTPPRDGETAAESLTGTIAVAETTPELPTQPTPVLRRSRSSEEEASGENPVQLLMGRMGDNALLYLLGGALVVALVIYCSLFIGSPRTNDEHMANFDGSRSARIEPVESGSPAGPAGTSVTATTSVPKPRRSGTAVDPSSSQKLDLAWLPPDAEWIVSLRPAELWGTPLLSGAFTDESWQSFVQLLAETSRLAVTDFERVTIGMTGIPEGADQSLVAGAFARLLTQADMIVSAHANKPVDAGSMALEKIGFTQATHGDRSYYRGPAAGNGAECVCLLFADKSRIIIGRESSLKEAIERNGKEGRRPELDFADATGALVVIGVPRALSTWVPASGGAGGGWVRLQQVLASQSRGVGVSLNLQGTASVDLAIDSRDSASLASIQQAVGQLLAERRQRFGSWPATVNPHLAEVFDRLSGNLKVESKGTAVHARGALPKLPEPVLAEITSWGSPLVEDAGEGEEEETYAELPSGMPRTPVTMLGVPGGLQMQAFVRWGLAPSSLQGPRSQPKEKPALRLQLVLDLKGGPAAGGMSRSICPTAGVTNDRGDKLAWRDEAFDGFSGRDMLRLVHGGDEWPADGVRIVLSCDRPALVPGTITGFEGSLTMRSARETKLVSIRNLRNYLGKSLPHPELKGSGLTFKVERAGNRLIVKATGRDLRLAGPGQAIDGNGRVLPDVDIEFLDSDSELQFILPMGEGTPRDAGLQIAVCTSVKDYVVPFHFERLEVPPVPKKGARATSPRISETGRPNGQPGRTTAGPGAATVIEPAELMQAFIDDPYGAKKKYQLQRLELTGMVVEIKPKGNVREIFLQVPQEGKRVSCDGFRDPTLIDGKISTGDTVRIRGSFLGIGNSDFVTLTQCELVNP